ncbi:hypothetical protein AMS68_006923 [Peltaster fructicola]|uniref:Pru domain-containing protein n=1 Tax=Peltaster fructicola TaxID=286661 RepID=A0A6H0Y378_9PEZI|nr:hypothetical protein AMS68_006923 [Peltaster fructicola]
MAENALITFKAGRCDIVGKRVTPDPQPGYIYIFIEDDLPHFCWRPRSTPASDPLLDLLALPGDVDFEPHLKEEGAEDLHSPTNGRVYVLRFASSGERHFFYLQSKSQHTSGDPSWFSERDQKLGQIVNAILQGEEVDVENEITELKEQSGRGGGAGGDEMDIDEPESGTGGAGSGATGGDARQEGEASREGGADGGRAHTQGQTSTLVNDFLQSLNTQRAQPPKQQQYTTLSDLLTSSNTIPFLQSATAHQVDQLCAFLPADLFLLAQESSSTTSSNDLSNLSSQASADATAAIAALSLDQKKEIIARVLRCPQLQQSLGSLTIALRDGGLPMIGDALKLNVEHGGLIRGGSMPLGGGDAVRGFVEGVKRTVEEERTKDKMEE